ncbi:diguanylate cyclase [Candidatus Halobeggiatoa sp. HSG11]|nr:diguanylate cyclase [Candidatus Halobeggiatoa sp. HSG11]
MTSTILIVDDEPNNLDVLNNCLHSAGFKVLAATNGEMALKRVAYKKPDLILLDINMPKMDGFETCKRLRENESTKDTPVIFVTALADIETKLKAFHAGGVDYITKPFVEEEVLARVRVHIRLEKTLERLEELSMTDTLTGAFNRRSVYKVLAQQIERTKKAKECFVLCYIDIDNLKIINDNYGHAEGDVLISTVVDFLRNMIRASDYVFRMGGDEFLIIFPKVKLEDSQKLIERIRKTLNKQKIHDMAIDFSFGFSEYCCKNDMSPKALIEIADENMYKAKMEKKRKMQTVSLNK